MKGGTQQIAIKCLDHVRSNSKRKEDFEVLLNMAVLEVIQDENDENELVTIVAQNTATGERTSFKTRRVVSSIPVNQYIRVSFKPELP